MKFFILGFLTLGSLSSFATEGDCIIDIVTENRFQFVFPSKDELNKAGNTNGGRSKSYIRKIKTRTTSQITIADYNWEKETVDKVYFHYSDVSVCKKLSNLFADKNPHSSVEWSLVIAQGKPYSY